MLENDLFEFDELLRAIDAIGSRNDLTTKQKEELLPPAEALT